MAVLRRVVHFSPWFLPPLSFLCKQSQHASKKMFHNISEDVGGKTGGACPQRNLGIGRTCKLTLGCCWLFCFVFVQNYFFPNKAERDERKGYPNNVALRRYMTVGRNIWIARGEVETALNDTEGFTRPESSTHCPTQAWNKNPWATFNFCKKRVHFGDFVGQGLI